MSKSKSGLFSGTSGALNYNNIQKESTKKNNLKADEMVKPLIAAGVKFTKENVIFVEKDKSGQLVWLESGNKNVGLEHIIANHSEDFAKNHGVKKDRLANHLQSILKNGKLEYSREVEKSGKKGYERLYSKNDRYYLIAGIGLNGFIITAYPISKEKALKLIMRYKK